MSPLHPFLSNLTQSRLIPRYLCILTLFLQGGGDIKSIEPLPLTVERLDSQGAFIVNDGVKFIVWFGSVLQPEFLVQLLGMEAVKTTDLSKVCTYC